jgi:hypothetical protein
VKRCDYCASTILVGGVEIDGLRFCTQSCASQAPFVLAAREVPEDAVTREAWALHHGPCPRCGGTGPIDVHTTHRVWSALLLTSWNSRPLVSCRSCAARQRAQDTLFSLALGWWGFPWGLVMTPIQVGRNVAGFFRAPDPMGPSEALRQMVRVELAARMLSAPPPA